MPLLTDPQWKWILPSSCARQPVLHSLMACMFSSPGLGSRPHLVEVPWNSGLAGHPSGSHLCPSLPWLPSLQSRYSYPYLVRGSAPLLGIAPLKCELLVSYSPGHTGGALLSFRAWFPILCCCSDPLKASEYWAKLWATARVHRSPQTDNIVHGFGGGGIPVRGLSPDL